MNEYKNFYFILIPWLSKYSIAVYSHIRRFTYANSLIRFFVSGCDKTIMIFTHLLFLFSLLPVILAIPSALDFTKTHELEVPRRKHRLSRFHINEFLLNKNKRSCWSLNDTRILIDGLKLYGPVLMSSTDWDAGAKLLFRSKKSVYQYYLLLIQLAKGNNNCVRNTNYQNVALFKKYLEETRKGEVHDNESSITQSECMLVI